MQGQEEQRNGRDNNKSCKTPSQFTISFVILPFRASFSPEPPDEASGTDWTGQAALARLVSGNEENERVQETK